MDYVLYHISIVLGGAYEFAQQVHMSFVDLKEAFNHVNLGVL